MLSIPYKHFYKGATFVFCLLYTKSAMIIICVYFQIHIIVAVVYFKCNTLFLATIVFFLYFIW